MHEKDVKQGILSWHILYRKKTKVFFMLQMPNVSDIMEKVDSYKLQDSTESDNIKALEEANYLKIEQETTSVTTATLQAVEIITQGQKAECQEEPIYDKPDRIVKEKHDKLQGSTQESGYLELISPHYVEVLQEHEYDNIIATNKANLSRSKLPSSLHQHKEEDASNLGQSFRAGD